jgi:hypothetical protein
MRASGVDHRGLAVRLGRSGFVYHPGASTNPLLSGAGLAIGATFVVLLVLAALFWSWLLARLTYYRRH